MCKSASEGGQRCYSHTGKTLAIAEDRYRGFVDQARVFNRTGRPVPAELRAKGLRARYDLDDALARYASTPQGEADLEDRMDGELTAERGLIPPEVDQDGDTTAYHAYAAALSEGRRLRNRAKDAYDAVKAGTMTGQEAANLTRYPNEQFAAFRDRYVTRIEHEDTYSRVPSRTRRVGPAGPPAPAATPQASVRKPVKDMQVGDQLSSGAVIVTAPTRGLRTPAGKHEVGVQYPNSAIRRVTWGSNTIIAVTPAVTPAATPDATPDESTPEDVNAAIRARAAELLAEAAATRTWTTSSSQPSRDRNFTIEH